MCNGHGAAIDTLQTDEDRERLELHSDIYALLAPYLPSWKIDLLLCLYYSQHPDAHKPVGLKNPNIAPIL